MTKKQNLAIWKELNEIELERAAYLINSDELIFETMGESIGLESEKLTKSLHIGVLEDIKIVQSINSPIDFLQSQLGGNNMASIRQYKCPTCNRAISISSEDFIGEIAMTTCDDCGRNAFGTEDVPKNG